MLILFLMDPGLRLSWAQSTPAQPSKKSAPAALMEIPRGTLLAVELADPVHSGKNKAGDNFRVRLNEGIWLRGKVPVPPGSTLRGLVTEATASGRVKGRSRLALTVRILELEGRSYAIKTDTLTYVGEPHTGRHLGSWLGGALQGALYGVLFGGKEGAVIGAGAGAAAGAGSAVLQGKQDIEFPQGSKLMFETLEPFSVPEPPAPGLPADTGDEKPAPKAEPGAKPST